MATADERPIDSTRLATADLPATPVRDRTIPASAWEDAPPELLELGHDIGHDLVIYKRRIGNWLLWRAGPPNKGDTRYMAVAADDPAVRFCFRLYPDGKGEGAGPSGQHTRFRTWKEDLRDHPRGGSGENAR